MATAKKVRKAQDGTVTKTLYQANKRYPDNKKILGTRSLDTTGYGAGKKDFTMKQTGLEKPLLRGESSQDVSRGKVKKFLKRGPDIQIHKKGGKVSKAQAGKTMSPVTVNATTMNRGKKTVQTSPGGAYKMKTTTNATGDTTRQVERRTMKGLLQGAPKARGVMKQTFKSGGKMKKK